jgi:hypothetical protein
VALRSGVLVFSLLSAEIAGSSSAEGTECSSLVFVVCCVVSGLCDGLTTRSEESYRVCVCVSNVRATLGQECI